MILVLFGCGVVAQVVTADFPDGDAGGPTPYFWLPIVAPLLGAPVGGAVLHHFIDVHLPTRPRRSPW